MGVKIFQRVDFMKLGSFQFGLDIIIIMSQVPKLINLLIEFGQKIEANLNKKYKTFIRSVLNLDTLSKTFKQERTILTKELIVFKLGLEAKSAKAVEISLSYLVKCFQNKFIDVNIPNLCENYLIDESGVKEQPVAEIKTEVRHLLIDLIKKNLVYKNNQINQLILKVLEFIISEPILPILLEISLQFPQEATHQVLFNFFSFRFYVYQEICYYSQKEIKSFQTISNRTERTEKEIKAAIDEDILLQDLISKYMNEYLSIIEKDGGRYGNCVMCAQPADHYCKITKASLCGLDCKKKHIEMAEHQYKHYFQSVNLWEAIHSSFMEMLIFLQTHESPLVFGVLAKLIDKPHLFMTSKQTFRALLAKHAPLILNRALSYKNENSFQNIYQFVVSLAKHWLYECLSTVQYFFRQYVLKVFEEKKPSFRFLNLICKALARVFEHGKVTVQLYINFDCEVNRQNIVQKVLFEVARILQDRFTHGSHLSKQERVTIKNNYLSLLIIIAMGLNQYRRQEPRVIETLDIVGLKQKKMSLEQFVVRFNESWTSGLKTLFNLNLVGLDSNEQIVDILMNLKGLNKENIDQLFFCEKGNELFEIFSRKLIQKYKEDHFLALLQLHHYIPLKNSSIGIRKYVQKVTKLSQNVQLESQINRWMQFIIRNYGLQQFSKELLTRGYNLPKHQVEKLYVYAIQTKQALTIGNNKAYFTYCCSRSYLEVIANQVALLQIPLSYMLETDFQIDRILALVEELVQICAHSNWISLLIKNSAIAKYPFAEFDESKLRLVTGVLDIVEKQAFFIQDWSTIINFLAFLYNVVQKVRAHNDSKVILQNQVPIARIERCLIEASAKSEPHFNKLLLAMLIVGRDQLEKDNLFMIQKFFEAVDRNIKTFMLIAESFIPYLTSFVKNLHEASVESVISIADMFKQTFAKLLKMPKLGETWAEGCEAEFWKLFESLGTHKSPQVNDFVVNCVSMSVLNHYDIAYKSWIVLFSFMKRRVADYRSQFYTILEKIVNSKMKGCEDFYQDLINICLDIIHPTQTKISIQALHLLKNALEIISELKNANSEDQQSLVLGKNQFKKVLNQVLTKLIQCLYYECHEYIIQLFFRLIKFKVNNQVIIQHEQMHQIFNNLFAKIEQFDKNTLQIAQKTLSYGLNWSVSNKYSQIVTHLENIIIDKYNNLSFSAVRCLKTYIQIVNPKVEQSWTLIQAALLHILRNTHLSDQIDLNISNLFEDCTLPIELCDNLVRVDTGALANKITVQKSVIDILPNHEKCIEELISLHDEVIKFNENLYLRILLWRRGLGSNDHDRPPNLLTLEQALASKIVATYQHLNKDNDLFEFSYSIFKRYCTTSNLLIRTNEDWAANAKLQSKQSENWSLYVDYLRLRKIPLLRIMNYFLPKLKRFCKQSEQRKAMTLILVQNCKYRQQRQGLLKAIKELAQRQN